MRLEVLRLTLMLCLASLLYLAVMIRKIDEGFEEGLEEKAESTEVPQNEARVASFETFFLERREDFSEPA